MDAVGIKGVGAKEGGGREGKKKNGVSFQMMKRCQSEKSMWKLRTIFFRVL